MATLERIVDDIDGTDGATRHDFVLDGVAYEIDLNDRNAAKLKKALEPYIAVARPAGPVARSTSKPRGRMSSPARRTRQPSPSGNADQKKAVREWAKSEGYEVTDRGRVPKAIQEAFELAHAPKAATTKSSKNGAALASV